MRIKLFVYIPDLTRFTIIWVTRYRTPRLFTTSRKLLVSVANIPI